MDMTNTEPRTHRVTFNNDEPRPAPSGKVNRADLIGKRAITRTASGATVEGKLEINPRFGTFQMIVRTDEGKWAFTDQDGVDLVIED